MQNFKERLRDAIERSGKSKGSLAESTGVALSTVSRWLGGSEPKMETVGQIADFLGVDAKWLLYGDFSKSLQSSGTSDFSETSLKEDARPYRFTPLASPAASPDSDPFEAVMRMLNRAPDEIARSMTDEELAESLTDWAQRYLQEKKSYLRAAVAGNLIVFSSELLRRAQDKPHSKS